MTSPGQWNRVIGQNAVDSEGSKVGKVGQIYLNDETGQPEWVTVQTGMFGNRESFAPLYGARPGDDQLVLAVPKQLIDDAPNVDSDGHIDQGEIEALYQHYAGHLDPSLQTGQGQAHDDQYADRGVADDQYADRGERGGLDAAGVQGRDTSGSATDEAMTRSEERLHVGTEQHEAGRVRLRKYVVTENVTTTVPVRHEEVRLEREPITDANRDAALDGADITEEEHEVTLHAERPVVEKEAVPVERVRLNKETVTEQHEINEQVRKEQIDEPDVDTGLRPDER